MSRPAALPLLLLLLLAACGPNTRLATDGVRPAPASDAERDRVEVTVPVARQVAIDRVVAAFVDEQLTVASSEGGIVRSAPAVAKVFDAEVAHFTYTATVVASGDTASRVIVAAHRQDVERTGGARRVSDVRRPVTARDTRGVNASHWQRVERIAQAVVRSR